MGISFLGVVKSQTKKKKTTTKAIQSSRKFSSSSSSSSPLSPPALAGDSSCRITEKNSSAKKWGTKISFINFSKWFYNECIYVYYVFVYINIVKIYENIWKWRKLLSSWASLPIPYTHLLLQSLKTAVFFSQACRPHLRSLGRAWKNAGKMISLTDLVFLGDGLKSKRSLKSFIFGFSWNFPRVMKLKEDFCRNFSLLLFKTIGGPNVPIKATVQVIRHVDPKDLPMEGHGIKKNVIIRHEKRSDRNRKVPPSCGWKNTLLGYLRFLRFKGVSR